MILTLNLYLNYLGHIQPNNLTELILGIHVEDLLFIKRHLPSMSFYESHRRQPSITTDCRKTLVISTKCQETCL